MAASARTAPLSPEMLAARAFGRPQPRLRYGSAQSAGLRRQKNQDHLLSFILTAEAEEALPDFGVFSVADGSAYHRSGEMASALAVNTVTDRLVRGGLLHLLNTEPGEASEGLEDLMRRSIKAADAAVVEGTDGGRTTLTVAVVADSTVTIGHVGDSRAYFVRDDGLRLLTRDQTYPRRLVDSGPNLVAEDGGEQARDLVWNALGMGMDLAVDVTTYPEPHGGHLLLCTGGLWGEVPEEVLCELVTQAGDPNTACEALVKQAHIAGGSENITVILVAF